MPADFTLFCDSVTIAAVTDCDLYSTRLYLICNFLSHQVDLLQLIDGAYEPAEHSSIHLRRDGGFNDPIDACYADIRVLCNLILL